MEKELLMRILDTQDRIASAQKVINDHSTTNVRFTQEVKNCLQELVKNGEDQLDEYKLLRVDHRTDRKWNTIILMLYTVLLAGLVGVKLYLPL